MEKIKSLINTELSMVSSKFFDLEDAIKQRDEFEKKLKFSIKDLLSSQKNSDLAKKLLGKKAFLACLALYFNQFDSKLGYDFKKLAKDIEEKDLVYKRHIGKDKTQYLKMLCRISVLANERPALKIVTKGLLREA